MHRDEILSKSRNENNQEFENQAFKNAQGLGIYVIIAVCIFFFFVNAVLSGLRGLEKGIMSFDYPAILFAYLSAVSFFNYRKTKEKNSLIACFGTCFAFLCMLILYFINI